MSESGPFRTERVEPSMSVHGRKADFAFERVEVRK